MISIGKISGSLSILLDLNIIIANEILGLIIAISREKFLMINSPIVLS